MPTIKKFAVQEIIGNLPVVINNDKFLAKCQSDALRIVDMRPVSLVELLLEDLLEFVLIVPSYQFHSFSFETKYDRIGHFFYHLLHINFGPDKV